MKKTHHLLIITILLFFFNQVFAEKTTLNTIFPDKYLAELIGETAFMPDTVLLTEEIDADTLKFVYAIEKTGSKVTDLTGIDRLHNLTWLDLSDAHIYDISIIKKITNLMDSQDWDKWENIRLEKQRYPENKVIAQVNGKITVSLNDLPFVDFDGSTKGVFVDDSQGITADGDKLSWDFNMDDPVRKIELTSNVEGCDFSVIYTIIGVDESDEKNVVLSSIFPDQQLAKAVADKLQVDKDKKIPEYRLREIFTLDLADQKISDVEGLKLLPYLEQLNINGNHIYDLTPLLEIPSLDLDYLEAVGQVYLDTIKVEDVAFGSAIGVDIIFDKSNVDFVYLDGSSETEFKAFSGKASIKGDHTIHWKYDMKTDVRTLELKPKGGGEEFSVIYVIQSVVKLFALADADVVVIEEPKDEDWVKAQIYLQLQENLRLDQAAISGSPETPPSLHVTFTPQGQKNEFSNVMESLDDTEHYIYSIPQLNYPEGDCWGSRITVSGFLGYWRALYRSWKICKDWTPPRSFEQRLKNEPEVDPEIAMYESLVKRLEGKLFVGRFVPIEGVELTDTDQKVIVSCEYTMKDGSVKSGEVELTLDMKDSGTTSVFVSPEILNVDVFPNPVVDFLTISNPTKDEKEITITDLKGRVLCHFNSSLDTELISTSYWEKGVYVVSVKSNEMTYTKRIVKE